MTDMNDVFDPEPPRARSICTICRCPDIATHARRAQEYAAEAATARQKEHDKEIAEMRAEIEATHARRAQEYAAESATARQKAHDKEISEMQAEIERLRRQMRTDDYQIVRVQTVGRHLVLAVKYPSCQHREFDCVKTLVFLHVTTAQAILWRNIDPHFRAPRTQHLTAEAPSPAARFPGTVGGWDDAVAYAESKR